MSLSWLLFCLLIAPSVSVFAVSVFASETETPIIVPTDFPTIQAAIDSAKNGDTILVMPGKYGECLTINKPLKLIGSGADSTMIEGDGARHTVLAEGVSGFTFANFAVKTAGNSSTSGIYIRRGSSNLIENVTVTGHLYGIHIYDSSGDKLRNCIMTGNKYNLRVWGLYLSHFLHDIDSSNLVNGQTVCYWVNQQNMKVPQNVGHVALVNCTNIVVKNLNLSHNLAGVLLAYTNNSLITEVSASENENGLYLVCSHNNLVVNNTFLNNYWIGILTISASNNSIIANVLNNNTWGIRLSHSAYLLSTYSVKNLILGNNVSNSSNGIYFESSNNNTVNGNVMENNRQYAIVFDQSDGNLLYKNTVKYNKCGIRVDRSNSNILYGNIFLNNTAQTSVYEYSPSRNIWDNGYPSGGNYWSDNVCVDEYSGRDQDQPGSDGICDAPYIVDANNQDRYPLCELPSQNKPPKAQFSYEPWEPRVQDLIDFRNLSIDSDGHIVLSIWNIDDMYHFQNQNVTHTFEEEGTYLIVLTVFDNEGEADTIAGNLTVRKNYAYLTFLTCEDAVLGENITISITMQSERDFLIADSLINFYLVDELGYEWIGSSFTNSSGVATIYFTTTKTGKFKIWAIYGGDQWHSVTGKLQDFVVREQYPDVLWILVIALFAVGLTLGIIKWMKAKRRKMV